MLSPIFGERALSLETLQGRVLLLADLHIGMTYELSLKGINVPSQISSLIDTGLKICETIHPDKILLLGDIKHVLPRISSNRTAYQVALAKEREEVLQFLEALHDYAPIEIIPGNHDGNLRKITSVYPIHPSSGISIPGKNETVGIIHGHAWPAREIMKCGYVVMGHIHPTVEIRNHLGQNLSHPCWIRTCILREKAKKRYGNFNPRCIIVPAFNPLCGGLPVNREGFVGPLGKIMDISQGCVYLLNGTNLGEIRHLQ